VSRNETYRRVFLALLVTAVTIGFVAVMRKFLITLLLAGIFSAMLNPAYERVVLLLRGHRSVASALTLVFIVLVVLLPLALFVGVLVTQAVNVSQQAMPWIQQQISSPSQLMNRLQEIPGFDRLTPYRGEILTKLGELAGTIGSFMASKLSDVTKGTLALGLQFVVMLYAMYFFLVDGGKVLDRILSYVPLSKKESGMIVERFVTVTRAALASTVVIAIVQGTLGGFAFAVAGINGAVFWGTLMGVTSMFPGVGTALVWVPAVAYLILSDHVLSGLLLLAFCALVVGSVDNVLRPRLVGKDTRLPDLVVLLSTLGGIMLFGPVGFIIGPVIAAVFITVWDIYAKSLRTSATTEPSSDSKRMPS
jgi:predicted PurR-regulated permease PerM